MPKRQSSSKASLLATEGRLRRWKSRNGIDHEVKLHITFGSAAELAAVGVDTAYTPTATLYVTYVFLDADERRRFAQTSHEYLISQIQHTGSESLAPAAAQRTTNVRLNLNHPTKFLAWVLKGSKHGQYTMVEPGTSDTKHGPISSVKLQLNGQLAKVNRSNGLLVEKKKYLCNTPRSRNSTVNLQVPSLVRKDKWRSQVTPGPEGHKLANRTIWS